MPWEAVGAFGGGIDFTAHPSALRSDQWTFSTGWIARDGYAETANDYIPLAALTLNPGEQIIGAVQNPFGQDGAIVGVVGAPGINNARLFIVTGQGVVTEITPSGTSASGTTTGVFQGTFINGVAVLSFGLPSFAGVGVIRWNGGANYVLVNTGVAGATLGLPVWHFLCGFQGHVVGALGAFGTVTTATQPEAMGRNIGWSDADTYAFPNPSIANSADNVVLDDAMSGITLLAPLGGNVALVSTRNTLSALSPTGAIPAFTRQLLADGIGAVQLRTSAPQNNFRGQSFWGRMAGGVVFAGLDDLYLASPSGSLSRIGTPIFRFWSRNILPTADPTLDFHQTFVWHERLASLFAPVPGIAGWMIFDPRKSAWSLIIPTAPIANEHFLRSAFIYGYNAGGFIQRQHWVTTETRVYTEALTPIPGGVVDTKDFAFGSPPVTCYVQSIKVDWEALTSVGDTLTVQATVHDDYTHQSMQGFLPSSFTGSVGLDTSSHFPFVTLGVLTPGTSELYPLRLKGKYIRFRFVQTSGHVRIRGFSIKYKVASDRRTS